MQDTVLACFVFFYKQTEKAENPHYWPYKTKWKMQESYSGVDITTVLICSQSATVIERKALNKYNAEWPVSVVRVWLQKIKGIEENINSDGKSNMKMPQMHNDGGGMCLTPCHQAFTTFRQLCTCFKYLTRKHRCVSVSPYLLRWQL